MTHPALEDAPTGFPESGLATLDNYYRGIIWSVSQAKPQGTLRTPNGAEIPFFGKDVRLAGAVTRFADLRPGMLAAFDVGLTPAGPRAVFIKTFAPGGGV